MSIQERRGCSGIIARGIHYIVDTPRRVAVDSGTKYYLQLLSKADKLDGKGSHELAGILRARAETHRTLMVNDGLGDPIQHSLENARRDKKYKLKR